MKYFANSFGNLKHPEKQKLGKSNLYEFTQMFYSSQQTLVNHNSKHWFPACSLGTRVKCLATRVVVTRLDAIRCSEIIEKRTKFPLLLSLSCVRIKAAENIKAVQSPVPTITANPMGHLGIVEIVLFIVTNRNWIIMFQ